MPRIVTISPNVVSGREAKRERNSSIEGRVLGGSHGVSKLSKQSKVGVLLESSEKMTSYRLLSCCLGGIRNAPATS